MFSLPRVNSMIKRGTVKKFIALLANFSLLVNSFVPFLIAVTPAYAQEIPVVETPAIVESTPTPEPTPELIINSELASPEPVEVVEPTPSIEPVNVQIGVLTPPVETPTPSPEPTITPEPIITETPTTPESPSSEPANPEPVEVVESPSSPETTPVPEIIPEPIVTETPVLGATVLERVCLTDQQIKDTTNEEWIIDDVNGISETKNKVQLGVKYVYPQENKVSVTFKCLPKDENLRTTLKIQKVKTSDLNLPDTMNNVGEYAYDITTGMTDGNFEYDVTLPKPENSTAEISYIEKSIDEAKSNLSYFDINKINSNIEQSGDTVKATSIDHFTIFIPTFNVIGSDWQCTSDAQGANDVPGQKDLTIMCRDQNSTNPLDISWNWDEISLSGSNTGDGCALFDTNSNGKANYAICSSWDQNQHELPSSPKIYLCNDTRPDRCTDTISPITTSYCDISNDINDPFTSGDSYPNDTKSFCSVNLADVGTAVNTVLLDVCSYPSQQPNSDPSDCILTPTTGQTGKLEIIKNLIPSDNSGLFNLLIDGITKVQNIGNAGTTGETLLSVGDHTFSETNGTNTNLSDYTTTVVCKDNNGIGSIISTTGSFPWTINIAKDKDIVCVITNTLNSTCGDGTINQTSEECDDGIQNGAVCTPPYGTNGQPASCNYCSTECKTVTLTDGYCGDNIKNGPEECDGSSGVPSGYSCSTCILVRNTGTITVDKVTNPSGDQTNFPFTVVSTETNTNQSFNLSDQSTPWSMTLPTGVYTVSEGTLPAGWSLSNTSCISDQGTPITGTFDLDTGENVTCTFTNTKDATLTLVKTVVNNNGGTATTGDFQAKIDGDNVLWGVPQPVSLSSHTASETNLTGYSASVWGGDCAADGTVSLTAGENKTCSITNDDISPTLKLVKSVTNDNGGQLLAGAWDLTASGSVLGFTDKGDSLTFHPVQAGVVYTLTESFVSGYAADSWICDGGFKSDNHITLDLDDDVTCTIVNNDIAPKLTLIKNVINNNGGTASPDNFLLTVGGQSVLSGVKNIYLANTPYIINETQLSGYSFTSITGDAKCPTVLGGTITLNEGDDITCTITNDDQQSYIIVDKTVTNNNGGSAVANDFKLTVDGNAVLDEIAYAVNPGEHTVGETNLSGYTAGTWGMDCGLDGKVTVALGQTKTCTITNDDQQAYITVNKVVTNNNGGSANPDDFNLTLEGNSVSSGVQVAVNPGTYTAAETLLSGYTFTGFDDDCDSNGDITVSLGESKSCTLTNDDQSGTLIVKKIVINDNGGSLNANDFTFKIGDSSPIYFEADGQNNLEVNAGTYSITEPAVSGYITTYDNCSSITIPNGGTQTCTITNDDIAPTLKLTKIVVNGSDGTKTASDWTLSAQGIDGFSDQGDSATFHSVKAGITYNLSESGPDGYSNNWWTCIGGGQASGNTILLGLNEQVTCTITNTRDRGSLTVNKVIDADGNLSTTNDQTIGENWQFDVDGLSLDSSDPNAQYTDINGSANFTNIKTGTYTVIETKQDGYELISANCGVENGRFDQTDSVDNVNISKDTNTICTFYNTPNGTIHGYKWSDFNSSGGPVVGVGESLLSGWTINLYQSNGDGGFESTPIKSMITDNGIQHFGWYWFEHLFPGEYKICESLQNGWIQTYPINQNNDCHIVNLPDDNSDEFPNSLNYIDGHEYNFGNQQLGNVNVTKFNDLDGDGQKDDGENNLPNWTINLTDQESQITNENGQVDFNNLIPGTYGLSEDLNSQPGWTQTGIYCEQQPTDGVLITSSGEAYGHHGNCEGWNGCRDAATCAQWACEVNGYNNLVSYGDQKPCTQFNNCNLFYSRGNVQMNWGNRCGVMGVTEIRCSNPITPTPELSSNQIFRIKPVIAQEGPSGYQVNVGAGQNLKCYIGNQRLEPITTISKTNNVTGNLSPGNSVEYTIDLAIADNNVNNLKVTDLLSDGFKYRLGSYKVYKDGADVTASVIEPPYHSPGVWDLTNLGTLTPENKIKLVYIADISTDQQAGTYKDLAWSIADYSYDSTKKVLATAQTGYVDTNFVGTEVPVVKNTQNSVSAEVERKEIIEGQVLGISSELPGTGAATVWLIITIILSVSGFGLIKLSKGRKQKMIKKIISIFILSLISLSLFTQKTFALTNYLSVQVEEPKSPTNIKDIELKFVTLDINGEDITAKCFKKGPTDSIFTQFGSDIILTNGGNASHCDLSSAITDNGSYQFYVAASSTSGSITSQTINLDYKNSTPGTPSDYRKEQINNCDFKIHFKTADDGGKTVKVELYRSSDSAFSANNESLVHSLNIGSNQEATILNSVPDCSKTYYFVLRAFDDAGNGSGIIGDTLTITSTTTATTTVGTTTIIGAIPIIGTNIAPETTISETTNPEITSGTNPEEGQVLGSKTGNLINQIKDFIGQHKWSVSLSILYLLLIIVYVIFKVRRSKK